MERATVDRKNGTVEIDGKKYEIGRELNEQTPSELFWSLLEGYETRTDFENYPGRIFFLVDGEIVMEFVQKTETLLVHKDRIWRKIEMKFNYIYQDIRELIKDQVEEHFNLRGVTPYRSIMNNFIEVGKHFNLK